MGIFDNLQSMQAGDKMVLTFQKSQKGPNWADQQGAGASPAPPTTSPMPQPSAPLLSPAAPIGGAPDERQMLMQLMAQRAGGTGV